VSLLQLIPRPLLIFLFRTAIAHCIREQELVYRKSLFLVGYTPDGSAIPDDELKSAFLPSLSSGTRTMDQVQAYTPLLNYVSDGEIDRNEKEREKELNKRRKRNTRGKRGVALPDREPNRTYRTPAVGFPELDASALAVVAANSAPTSRRAAAAAASLNIANMVASENGMPVQSLLPTAQQATPTAAKEKKPRGLFKAPTVPPDALSSRAGVSAPTSSTAAKKGTFLKNLDNDPPPPPRAGMTIISTRPKEDVKEPELIEGQHPNMIEGVWHCSNCGCPESIAVGRRKGPLGDKSQCGQCGKSNIGIEYTDLTVNQGNTGIVIDGYDLWSGIQMKPIMRTSCARLRCRSPPRNVVHAMPISLFQALLQMCHQSLRRR